MFHNLGRKGVRAAADQNTVMENNRFAFKAHLYSVADLVPVDLLSSPMAFILICVIMLL